MCYQTSHLNPPALTPAGPVEGLDDPAELAAYVRSHAATDSEVRTLCKDLQVSSLGARDWCAGSGWQIGRQEGWALAPAWLAALRCSWKRADHA